MPSSGCRTSERVIPRLKVRQHRLWHVHGFKHALHNRQAIRGTYSWHQSWHIQLVPLHITSTRDRASIGPSQSTLPVAPLNAEVRSYADFRMHWSLLIRIVLHEVAQGGCRQANSSHNHTSLQICTQQSSNKASRPCAALLWANLQTCPASIRLRHKPNYS